MEFRDLGSIGASSGITVTTAEDGSCHEGMTPTKGGAQMLHRTRRLIGTVATTAMLVGAGAGPALAQVEQDGLVNVNIGDVTILEDVNVNVAANIVAAVCADVDLAAAVLAVQGVDFGGTEFSCPIRRSGQELTVTQN
jgi:hypothetical protein